MSSSAPADQPTDRSIAERLALLCCDADKGKVTDACSIGILHGIGGALLIDALVSALASTDNLEAVRDRLVDRGALEVVEDRILGIFPRTRHPAVDPAPIEAVRSPVRDLLTGAADPEQADPADIMVAAFTEPVGAVPLLIDDRSRCNAAAASASSSSSASC